MRLSELGSLVHQAALFSVLCTDIREIPIWSAILYVDRLSTLSTSSRSITGLCLRFLYTPLPLASRILNQATHQITSSRISHDIKNDQNSHNVTVSGNIKNYQQPVSVEFHTPIRIKPTKQYELRKDKFHKWLEIQPALNDDQSS